MIPGDNAHNEGASVVSNSYERCVDWNFRENKKLGVRKLSSYDDKKRRNRNLRNSRDRRPPNVRNEVVPECGT